MLNTEKVGRPLCRVVGGELSKKVVSVSTDEETQREFQSSNLFSRILRKPQVIQMTDKICHLGRLAL